MRAKQYRLNAQAQARVVSLRRLAYYLAHQWAFKYGLDVDDAESYAVERLCRAAHLFNPRLGINFEYYAEVAIKTGLRGLMQKRFLKRWRPKMISLSAFGKEDNRRGFDLPDARSEERERQAEVRELLQRVEGLLSPSERRGFQMLWAFLSEGRTFNQIGETAGISGSSARNLIGECIRRLRERAPELVVGEPVRCNTYRRVRRPART